jgi:ATP-dependent DNA helicase RecG
MYSSKLQIFVSSVQKEFQKERYAIRDYVNGDALLSQFFTVFLFEDLPPRDQHPDEVYLDVVEKSPIYVGLFGDEYGWEDGNGLSPPEKEFQRATELKKRRLIFIRKDNNPVPKMRALIGRAENELVRKRFVDIAELKRLLYGSLIHYLQDEGIITTRDFDARKSDDATLADISSAKVGWFLETAKAERGYALAIDTPAKNVLAHLNLLVDGHPSKGALLLFGRNPARHVPSADINCLHFHGTEVAKPIPSQQVYKGTLFEMVDAAVDFVMSRLARSVVPSGKQVASDVQYEIPYKVVREAIVNAAAHRNYASNAGVQVMLFADRLEVWNPGGLPEDLTVEQLRHPHHSIPRNRLLCESLFLAHYIERAGTGTLDMIKFCAVAGLPEPQFRNEGEHFVATIWRDWLTDEVMKELGLNERQKKVISYLKQNEKVTNREYQDLTGVIVRTAARDLKKLVECGVLRQVGVTGRNTYYTLVGKQDSNRTPPAEGEQT